ncbi:MAG: hypothetical protein Fur005_14100 [Roseiflexaceae bacterium]
MRRLFFWGMLLSLIASSVTLTHTVGAQARQRCFSETGYCISGVILTYWERNGGLPVFGYPISNLAVETNSDGWTGPTQLFERDRLEDHSNEGLGVLAGRLGVRWLELQGRSWQSYERVEQPSPGCRYFAVTGHQICGEFRRYWEQNGGLERFGYPITEALQEYQPEWGGTVQYFERRRMELHPEFAGTQYEVLLGLLGRDIRQVASGCIATIANLQKTAAAFPGFTCGAPFPQINVDIVTQPFERGQMIYLPPAQPGSYGSIWVIFYDNGRRSLVWKSYPDTYGSGDPVSGGETPPAGLVEPLRGFGKIWRTIPEIRNTVGWAVSPEFRDMGHMQYFRGGNWLIYRAAGDRVFVLREDGTAEDIARLR